MSASSLPETGLASEAQQARQLLRALLLLGLMVAGGTLGFMSIEGWTTFRAFYFTLITITTVGYGDLGLSEAGRKFAAVLLIGGVGAASYSFAMVLQTSITRQLAWKKRMQKRIVRLSNHVIVCGYGRMGRSVCERLRRRGLATVVIERDPQTFLQAVEAGHESLEGSATEDDVLRAAGIERASHLVAAMASTPENIVACMGAKELHPEITVVARAESRRDAQKLERAGADRVVSPFQSGGDETVRFIAHPEVADFLANATLGDGDVSFASILVVEGSPLVGTSLAHYGRTAGTHISFVALQRPDASTKVPPGGNETLQAGDTLIVAGDPAEIEAMRRRASSSVRRANADAHAA